MAVLSSHWEEERSQIKPDELLTNHQRFQCRSFPFSSSNDPPNNNAQHGVS